MIVIFLPTLTHSQSFMILSLSSATSDCKLLKSSVHSLSYNLEKFSSTSDTGVRLVVQTKISEGSLTRVVASNLKDNREKRTGAANEATYLLIYCQYKFFPLKI